MIFEIISSSMIVLGLTIGLLQLRQYHLARKREAATLLLNSYRTKDFLHGIALIVDLDPGMTKSSIDGALDQDVEYLYLVMSAWESLGILLFHREVTIDLIDEAHSGPILVSWNKLEGYVTDLRRELDRDTMFEWFEWLVDRMKERENLLGRIPANIAYKNWK